MCNKSYQGIVENPKVLFSGFEIGALYSCAVSFLNDILKTIGLYAGHSHQSRSLRRAAVVRDGASIDNWLCAFISLAGTAKPQTFLWSYTSLMEVQLTFELELR